MNFSTVIAAVSTPPGKGGVAIIRMSGDGAFEIAEKVFTPKSKKSIFSYPARTQIFGNVVFEGEEIDDGLLSYFKAPFSYTGEDLVEISCHGGALVTRTVLEALFVAGAKPAEAGEFTKRAMINGKLSLTEAEAIGNVLEAKTRAQIMLNTERSRSNLAQKIEEIRKDVLAILSSMFARIDYPDEDLGDFNDDELLRGLSAVEEKLCRLIASYKTGSAISNGIEAVICGKANAGKSTLYNLMLGENAAIVTDIKGTTRDVLTREMSLGRVLIKLSDTAGIREKTKDEIELIGIEKTKNEILRSALILAVFDASEPLSEEDSELLRLLNESSAVKIAIINKCDLERKLSFEDLKCEFEAFVEISAKHSADEAKAAIAKEVNRLFTDEKISLGEDAVITNARQNSKLVRAQEFIRRAKSAIAAGVSQDAASSDVERALGELAELDGKEISDEVLSDIFKNFCVGK